MEPQKEVEFISLPMFQTQRPCAKVQFSNPLACHHEIREVGTSHDGVRDVMGAIGNMKINKEMPWAKVEFPSLKMNRFFFTHCEPKFWQPKKMHETRHNAHTTVVSVDLLHQAAPKSLSVS